MTGTALVIRFNWPKYLAAAALVVAAAAAAGAPALVAGALWLLAGPAAVWTVTSVVATWWVYDHRNVYLRLAAGLSQAGDWAAVHAGFDESVPALRAAIGRPPSLVAEIPLAPGASLRRARRLRPGSGPGPGPGLTLGTGSLDTVFVTFAAHEVRDLAGQRALFRALSAALRPGGRLVITEHPRDAANFAVYGPGAMHFQPLATWHARAAEAGLSVASQVSLTPFVRRVVFRR